MAAEEAAAAVAALCPCACPFCCYRCPPAWRRPVKRKLDAEAESEDDAAAEEELREKVRMQEETIQELWAELEQEQSAASTAASETMSMILRLQQEKAELAMEARQSKRFADEQIHHLHAQILSLEDLLAGSEDDDDDDGDDDDFGGCDAQDPISESGIARLEPDTIGDDDDATARALEEAMERTQRLEREKEEAEAEARRFRSFARDLEEELARRELAIETYRDLLRRHRIPLDDDDDDGPVAIVDHGESDREEEEDDDDDDDDLRGSGELREPYPLVEPPRSPQRSEPIDAEELPSCAAEFPTPSDGDCKWDDDDDDDRVYTIDAVYGAPSFRVSGDGGSGAGERVEVKKLSARVEALEAEGEAMRRAMVAMGAEMARLALVREIAQRLCKEVAMERMSMVTKRRRSLVDTSAIIAIFKWICSLFCWRRKASRSRYTLGISNYNVGLLLLLDKSPRMSQWRMLSRPQG